MRTPMHTRARTRVSPLSPVNDKLHKTRAGLMPSTGYNVDRAFFRLAMQETLIIIREYNAFIFRRMPELLARSLVRACVRAYPRACSSSPSLSLSLSRSRLWNRVERYRLRGALINGDGQIDDFLRDAFVFTRDIFKCSFSDIGVPRSLAPPLENRRRFAFCGIHRDAGVPRSLFVAEYVASRRLRCFLLTG